jgi:hypothetical protein
MDKRRYKVYNKKNLSDPTDGSQAVIKEIKAAEVTSFENTIGGYGAANIDIHFWDINSTGQRDLTLDDLTVNSWIFIIDTSISAVTDDPSTRFNPLTSLNDRRIVWWGFISSRTNLFTLGLRYYRGSIQCYEMGKWLDQEQMEYPSTANLSLNGFNPLLNGVFVGNRKPRGETPEADYEPDIGTEVKFDITSFADYYWSNKDICDFICKKNIASKKIQLKMDWSKINLVQNDFLTGKETIASYSGQSFADMLRELIRPLNYVFKLDEYPYIKIQVVDPNNSTNPLTYLPSPSRESISITNQESAYDEIRLIGDKVLVSGSISTSVPRDKFYGIDRGWTDQEAKDYVKPPRLPASVNVPINKLKDQMSLLENSLRNAAADAALQKVISADVSSTLDSVIASVENERRSKHKKVYQQYVWRLGNLSDLGNTRGNCLLTTTLPGDIFVDAPGRHTIIPFFPELKFQNTNSQGVLQDALDEPVILNNGHRTPLISEMSFESFIPIQKYEDPPLGTVGGSHQYYSQTFWYKVLGPWRKYGSETHAAPMWVDGTNAQGNFQNFSFNAAWNGLEINSPYPEMLATPYDDIMGDFYSLTDFQTKNYFNAQHDEWNTESLVGPSKYDPVRTDYISKGFWKRLVFTISAYSSQNIEVIAKNPTSTVHEKVLTVNDPSYKLYMIRKGCAVKTQPNYNIVEGSEPDLKYPDVISVPEWALVDSFPRNDLPKMKKNMKLLKDFYFKPRRAIRIVDRIYNENAEPIVPSLVIGDVIKEIREQGPEGLATVQVNSYVASIQVVLGNSPRTIIQTEYPNGPIRSRNTIVYPPEV